MGCILYDIILSAPTRTFFPHSNFDVINKERVNEIELNVQSFLILLGIFHNIVIKFPFD